MLRNSLRIARKELAGFFTSPVAYIFLGTFLLVTLFCVFWADAFFAHFGDCLGSVRARYDAVVFMESAAVGGLSIGSDNSARVEARQEASALLGRTH